MTATLAPDSIGQLVESVLEATGTPIDVPGVAATLESRGLRDLDAVERYGRRDVFDLAGEVYSRAQEERPGRASWQDEHAEQVILRGEFLKRYLRGAFSFLPLLLQLLLLVTVGYSQWGWVHFSVTQASLVALGIGLSLLGTGPLVQVLGYLGPSLAASGKHRLAEAITYRVLLLGLAGAAGLAALVSLLVLATGAYSPRELGIVLVYDLLVSTLWLLNAALYMLRRHIVILVAIAASTPVVGVVLRSTRLGIYAAHWLGLTVAIALELSVVALILRRRARTTSQELRHARLPRPALLLRSSAPLAVYGLGYFVLLLGDRAVAWSAGRHPLALWFNVHYELGLDCALLAAAFGIAFLECLIFALGRLGLPMQGRFSGLAISEHNRWYLRFHQRQLLTVTALLVFGVAAVSGLVATLHALGALGPLARFYADPVTRRVFLLGSVGLGLMAIGLANCGLLFVVARSWKAAFAVSLAALADVSSGYVASRAFGFSWAVVGLLVGAAVFALVSGAASRRVLRAADYYLFSAY
jgi:hypothetical protein